jgi:predicted transcriptional regulator
MQTTNQTLKVLIEKSGLTPYAFAKKHGIHLNLVYRWMSNHSNIKLSTLEKIAHIEGYELTVHYELHPN